MLSVSPFVATINTMPVNIVEVEAEEKVVRLLILKCASNI